MNQSALKKFAEKFKSLGFFNVFVIFFLGHTMVPLTFIGIEIDGFSVFVFLNVSQMWKIFRIFCCEINQDLKSQNFKKIRNFSQKA